MCWYRFIAVYWVLQLFTIWYLSRKKERQKWLRYLGVAAVEFGVSVGIYWFVLHSGILSYDNINGLGYCLFVIIPMILLFIQTGYFKVVDDLSLLMDIREMVLRR